MGPGTAEESRSRGFSTVTVENVVSITVKARHAPPACISTYCSHCFSHLGLQCLAHIPPVHSGTSIL